MQLDPCTPDGFCREEGGGDARFHVAGATPVDAPVAHGSGKGVDRPSVAGGDDIVVAVEMNGWAFRASAANANHVDARVRAGVLHAAVGRDSIDVEAAGFETIGDESRAVRVVLARWIHRRHSDQIGREADDLRRGRIHGFEHAIGDTSAIHLLEISPLCGSQGEFWTHLRRAAQRARRARRAGEPASRGPGQSPGQIG